MTDLKAVIQNGVRQHHSKNIEEANRKCDMADEFIQKAQSEKEKEHVNNAIDLYMEALNLYSKCIRAHVSLAYITYASGDSKTAKKILNTAQEYAPFYPDIKNLSEEIDRNIKNEKFNFSTSDTLLSKISKKKSKIENKNTSIFERISKIFSESKVGKKPDAKINKDSNAFIELPLEVSNKINNLETTSAPS